MNFIKRISYFLRFSFLFLLTCLISRSVNAIKEKRVGIISFNGMGKSAKIISGMVRNSGVLASNGPFHFPVNINVDGPGIKEPIKLKLWDIPIIKGNEIIKPFIFVLDAIVIAYNDTIESENSIKDFIEFAINCNSSLNKFILISEFDSIEKLFSFTNVLHKTLITNTSKTKEEFIIDGINLDLSKKHGTSGLTDTLVHLFS